MRVPVFIFNLLLLVGCNSSESSDENETFYQASIAFAELKSVLENEDGKLWNYDLRGPILLVNPETRAVIANEPDTKGELAAQGDLFIGSFPENLNIANTAVDWNEKRWTMVLLPLPDNREERLNLMIHESFHRVQPLIGFDSFKTVQSTHLDSKDGRIFLKLELEALKKALRSDQPEGHIKNALLFRQYRYQLFPDAKNAENSLEINEGLAEYTGSILSQRSDTALRRHYIEKIDWSYTVPTFVRSFAYYTIPVYGYFMRQSDDKWNLKITRETNLSDLVFSFYGVKDLGIDQKEIMTLAESYDYPSINEFETQRELNRLNQIARYKAMFLDDSIISIALIKMSIQFNPSNIMPLDSLGTVYPNMRVTDEWGILNVDSGGALLSREWDNVSVSDPEFISDTVATGKGWKLKLNDSWRLHFTDGKYSVIKK